MTFGGDGLQRLSRQGFRVGMWTAASCRLSFKKKEYRFIATEIWSRTPMTRTDFKSHIFIDLMKSINWSKISHPCHGYIKDCFGQSQSPHFLTTASHPENLFLCSMWTYPTPVLPSFFNQRQTCDQCEVNHILYHVNLELGLKGNQSVAGSGFNTEGWECGRLVPCAWKIINNWGKCGEKKDVLEFENPKYEDPSSLTEFWTSWETQATETKIPPLLVIQLGDHSFRCGRAGFPVHDPRWVRPSLPVSQCCIFSLLASSRHCNTHAMK